MADNIDITPGTGTTVAADEVTDGTLGSVKVGFGKIMDGTLDSTNKLIVNASGEALTKDTTARTSLSSIDSKVTDVATQTTLALIKAKTDNIDVALSTRTRPADTQTISGAVTTSTVDTAPATQNITVVDSGSTSTVSANGQALITGSPTANSAATFTITSQNTIRVQVTGTWTGTLAAESSIDGGTTWFGQGLHQGAFTTGTFTANFVGGANISGATNFRIRATAAITGTATVKVIESTNEQSVYIANAAPSGNLVSLLNSTTATLTSGSTFTGTGEDSSNFSEIRVSVIASHASATDGLSIQQSTDNSNWDITDTYTIPATTGKTFAVPRQARYVRVVYTNGGTNQTSFRLQTILNRTGTAGSSQRSQDAYSNENDLEQVWAFGSVWNGSTWDRTPGTTTGAKVTGGLAHDAADSAANIPVKVGAQARTTLPTAVSDADVVNAIADKNGRMVVVPHGMRDLASDQNTTITASTSATTIVTADANFMLDLVSLTFANTSATASEVVLYDDDGTTVRWVGYAPAGDMRGIVFSVPLKQTAVNKTWKFKTVTSISSCKITAQFVKNV